MLGLKNVGSDKNVMVGKISGPKKICVRKTSWVQNKFVSEIFLWINKIQKIPKSCGPENVGPEKNVRPSEN